MPQTPDFSHLPDRPAPQEMSPEAFRAAGQTIVERIARYFEAVRETPVLPDIAPGSIRKQVPERAPDQGKPFEAIMADFEEVLYPGLTHWNSPRYMAYFPSSASAPGALGEMLAAGFGQNNMLWRTSPAGTELEVRVMEWLRDLFGLSDTFFGEILDTASTSSLVALAAAREKAGDLRLRSRGLAGRAEVPRLIVYASDQAHSSIDKAAMTLGYGLEQVRKIPSDEAFRMRADALRAAVGSDLEAGHRPLAVVGTLGTTSSTSVDPAAAIADIAEEFGLWFHIDAAYAGSAAAVPEKRALFEGWERADSIVVNPHKWLFTPMDFSAFFVRDREKLRSAFSLVPEYLTSDLDSDEELVNLMDYGFQLGRRWRSLKMWMILRWYGAEGIRDRLRYHMELADGLARIIEEQDGVELVAPVPFATVCFRFRPQGWEAGSEEAEQRLEGLNRRVMDRANATGQVFLSHTKLDGVYTLRLAIGHPRTTAGDVRAVWDLLTGLARAISGEMT
ncbi:MAG: pyridoxal-dependent decarboxylase [bacterium]